VRIRIGARGSDLAQAQAREIARKLEALGHEAPITVVSTSGDADQKSTFAQIGAPGVFVRELEAALCAGRVDLAVHSYKDLPSDSAADLLVAAVPGREDARDRLLIRPAAHDAGARPWPLARGSRVGSSAARRAALLRAVRPDLKIALLRGNVPTRLARLARGEVDAIVLAAAGLERLGRAAARGECRAPARDGLIEQDLDPRLFVPAPSQGALALQVRARDEATRAVVASLDDPAAGRAVRAERELLRLVQAGCDAPFGAHCAAGEDGRLELAAVLEVDGRLRRARAAGAEPDALARAVFAALRPEEAPLS